MDGYQIVVISTIGGVLGILIAGPFFDCKVPPVKAFAAALISGLCYMIPSPVGAILSLMVLIYLVGLWGTGDWMDAAYTSFVARGVMLPVALMFDIKVW